MIKFIFFNMWNLEYIENLFEVMEQRGYRLDKIKHSYWFYFKPSKPKKTRFFLTYKSIRKSSMGLWDYALTSSHKANPIKTHSSFYSLYRITNTNEDLLLLYEGRMDFIKRKLFEKAITSLVVTVFYAAILYAASITSSTNKWIIGLLLAVSICFNIYYFYGFFVQKRKCKKYEQEKFRV